MRYLCLLIGEPDMEVPAPGTPEFAQMLSDYGSATQAMAADGVLVDSGPLQPPSAAATLRVRGGEQLVTDGPFAELKEQIGGYAGWDEPPRPATPTGPLPLDPPPAEREFLVRRLAEISRLFSHAPEQARSQAMPA